MNEKKYGVTLSFMKRRDFENGGYVIQWAIPLNVLKEMTVRDGKIFVKLNELKEETQYGAKYVLVEDDYMANYKNEGKKGLVVKLEEEKGPMEELEVEVPFTPKVTPAEQKKIDQSPVDNINIDDLFS